MGFPDSKLLKLSELLKRFVDEEMAWEAPLQGEKEPNYTARILAPQVDGFLKSLNEPGLQMKADGHLRPVPIVFEGRQFFPDISIDYLNERVVAVECKFLSSLQVNSALTTAIGQAVVYRSLGYRAAMVLLVSRQGSQSLPAIVRAELDRTLVKAQISISELHSTNRRSSW